MEIRCILKIDKKFSLHTSHFVLCMMRVEADSPLSRVDQPKGKSDNQPEIARENTVAGHWDTGGH